jgi:phosphoribosylglycinamide formyltransferase-1
VVRVKAAVLISGRGSNLQALLDAGATDDFPVEIALVISNIADAYGLQRASRAGVPTLVVSHKDYPNREAFDAALDVRLRQAGIELVCLAGFMRLLSAGFVESWRGRMINIHPSLLPSFKGLHTHAQALAAGVKLHGCSVHYVTPALDDGPIIAQAAVPVLIDDDEERLAARVLAAEHQLYPLALRLLAEKQNDQEKRQGVAEDPDAMLINPPALRPTLREP